MVDNIGIRTAFPGCCGWQKSCKVIIKFVFTNLGTPQASLSWFNLPLLPRTIYLRTVLVVMLILYNKHTNNPIFKMTLTQLFKIRTRLNRPSDFVISILQSHRYFKITAQDCNWNQFGGRGLKFEPNLTLFSRNSLLFYCIIIYLYNFYTYNYFYNIIYRRNSYSHDYL